MSTETTQRNRFNVQGISFPSRAVLNAAKKRADELGLSLSNYVNRLVKDDLKKGGPMTIVPSSASDQKDLTARIGRDVRQNLKKKPASPTPEAETGGSSNKRD